MIRIDVDQNRLRPSERYGLDVLLDLSRLLVAEHSDCDLVRITLLEKGSAGSAAADISPHAALERGEGEVRVTLAALQGIAEIAGGAAEQRPPGDLFGLHGRPLAVEEQGALDHFVN